MFFNKVAGAQKCNFIKKKLQQRYFAVSFVNCSKTPILSRGYMNSWFLKHLFKNTFFNRAIPVAPSDSFRFPACNFIKKLTPAKTLLCEICKIFKNIFLQNTTGWLLLLFTCNFEKFFRSPIFRAPLENSLFNVQVAEFQAPDKMKSISQALFEHLIRKQDVAIRRRSFT